MRTTAFVILLIASIHGFAFPEEVDPAGETEPTVIKIEGAAAHEELAGAAGRAYGVSDFDPGNPPEGDYLGTSVFTKDGGRILLTNRMTDNVTVFDWAAMTVVTNIDVGRYPSGIAVTDDYAIVACAFADQVYVIDLDDYSIAGVVATGEQPWVVRSSPDGRHAYVACDIANTCEKIDLTTMETVLTIPDFPIGLLTWAFTSENGRNRFAFTEFELTHDGRHIVTGDWDDSVLFYNTTTGTIDYAISGIPSCYSIAISGDGNKVVALSGTIPVTVHQIDVPFHVKASTVGITGKQVGMTYDIGVSADGWKAYVSVDGNQSAIVRFLTGDYTLFSQTYSAFWIGTSPDHDVAISGQYRFSIIDFASETMLGQHQGNTQYGGAVSPVGRRVVGSDPMTHEGLYFYDYANPAPPTYRGTADSGLDPEGDAPRRVAITPDGGRAVITNVLSDNAAILDLSSCTIEAYLPIGDRVQDVAITSDSQWAVVCGFNSNSVKIVDLTMNAIVADVPCGTRPGVVTLTPDDAHAYIGDIQSNTVSVVELNGAASQRIAQLAVGTIGVSWAAYGVSSDVEASPTGEYVLVAVSFDDQVKVIDTVTNSIVATLDVGDFPLQIAFNGTGDYAMVTNYLSSSISVLRIDGAGSYVVGTYYRGGGPLRLSYDAVGDRMCVCNLSSQTVAHLDPETGDLLGTDSYTAHGSPIQVLTDESGETIVLTQSGSSPPGHLHRGTEMIALPATPSYFDYCPATGRAVVVMPGPDYVSVAALDPAGAEGVITIPLRRAARLDAPAPNPVREGARFGFRLEAAGDVELLLVDPSGRRVATIAAGQYAAGAHRVAWKASGVAPGGYFAILKVGGDNVDAKKVALFGSER